MKIMLGCVFAVFAMFAVPAFASDAQTSGQVKIELIRQLERDGHLTPKSAEEARQKYVDPRESTVPLAAATAAAPGAQGSVLERYLSWTNFLKVVGVVLLLVAFGRVVVKAAKWAMLLIIQVPKEVYQAAFFGATLTATLRPDLLWASQAFYLALFGAFANLVVLAWVVGTHPKLEALISKLFSKWGIPGASVGSFLGMLYFAALALAYQSQIFGFFAAVCLSGVFSFALMYRPGLLMMYFHEKATGAVVFGHLVVLVGYAVHKVTGHLPAEAALFAAGLEYYCTIAMGVGFLVGASPWRRNGTAGGYLWLFVVVLFAAVAGYFFFDLKVIGSVLSCFGALLALEWLGFLSYRRGFLAGTFALGAALYGSALLMERYAHLIVLRIA